MKDPVVSVIIPVYNGTKYLAETLESVISQTFRDWEVIAVNDGSSDESEIILEKYASKYPFRIRYLTVQNGGVSRARNTGVSQARGKYVAFLDQDDLWTPEKLERQVEQLENNPELGVSFTNESLIDESGFITRFKRFHLGGPNRGFVFDTLIFDNFIPVSSLMMHKDIFLQTGGFSPEFALSEDFDFLLRITRKYPVDFIDAPLLQYREHSESGTHINIDRITRESMTILQYWKKQDPAFFRKHILRYGLFRLRFFILKGKIILKKYFQKKHCA